MDGFQILIRRNQDAALDKSLTMAAVSLLALISRGLALDHLAVRAAISSACSNAQAEGQINKLKVVNVRCLVEVTGVRPCGWTKSSGSFDRLLGVLILELHRAEIAQSGVQPF